MSLRATKLKLPHASPVSTGAPKSARKVSVADALSHTGQGSPVHDFQTEIERAYSASQSIEFNSKKIPFVVTVIGAVAFSAACWAAIIGLVSAL
ncbi:hypothetical protein MMA231_04142 (plasmid) [Asticcacaulis sp. MM231]|uniref:hypothetical protein n=1 Tax=Asticcacaulis sp. MM231 TaxID=3157666 RepID=UPI0032D5A7AC